MSFRILQGSLSAVALAAAFLFSAGRVTAQDAAAAQTAGPPRQTGTVKTAGEHALVLTNKAGHDVNVEVTPQTKVLIVPPGSTNLSAATAGTLTDVQTGDRALVTGTAGDTATSLNAVRVIVMKSSAIAQARAAESSAWAQGTGGIVKSVSNGTIVISSRMKTVTISTTPQTIVRRYAPGSVKFEDAVASTVSAIQPGDQLRVRGASSEDGSSIKADEIVTGSFANYSGTIASIDASAGTITLKDLATKKSVTVAVTPGSDLRRLPPQAAMMIAMRLKGGGAGPAGRVQSAGSQAAPPAAATQGATGGEAGQRQAGAAAGNDLSHMLPRLPTETLGGLKPGEAVMIVASPSAADPSKSTAITLLAGVEPILAAPAGSATTLSPWNVSGGSEAAAGMGGATP